MNLTPRCKGHVGKEYRPCAIRITSECGVEGRSATVRLVGAGDPETSSTFDWLEADDRASFKSHVA
jgi:hypothetical protein